MSNDKTRKQDRQTDDEKVPDRVCDFTNVDIPSKKERQRLERLQSTPEEDEHEQQENGQAPILSDFDVDYSYYHHIKRTIEWLERRGADSHEIRAWQAAEEAAYRDLGRKLWQLRHETSIPPLGPVKTMDQDLATERAPLIYTVKDLHARDGNLHIIAQNKRGKTTLALNLVRALLDGEPFLGQFDTYFPKRRILYLNYEVSRKRFESWVRTIGLNNTNRLVVMHLRGMNRPINADHTRREVIGIARRYNVGMIIVDPLQKAFPGSGRQGDPNDEMNRMLDIFDQLKVAASIDDAVIVAHAGNQDSDRARGASAIGGSADNTWVLTSKTADATSTRMFSAYGRDVELNGQHPLRFHSSTLRLTMPDTTPDKPTAQPLGLPDHGLLAVERCIAETDAARGVSNIRKYFRGLEGSKHSKALKAAVVDGYLDKKSEGSAQVFTITEAGQLRCDELRGG